MVDRRHLSMQLIPLSKGCHEYIFGDIFSLKD